MNALSRGLKCRLETSGHSRVVVFHREDGEEVFVLPAERLDPVTLEKVRAHEIACAVDAPQPDGTSALTIRDLDGELLLRQKVWIRAGTWSRLLREH